jgi:pimeloyl-ACP methyl ester carboxylesterase
MTTTDLILPNGLGATLMRPEGATACALIHQGSGVQDRDGNMPVIGFASSLYKRLARELARHGIASLRFDKRGHDAPGVFEYTVPQRLEDARVALVPVREQGLKTFLVGHSEGAMIVAKLAETESVDGVVSLAAPFGNTIELGRFRAQRLVDSASASQQQKGARALEFYERLEAYVREGASLTPKDFAEFAAPYLGAGFHGFESYEWLAGHWAGALDSDPTQHARRMLVVQGGRDARMYPDNPERWQKWCKARELADFVKIDHMGHDLNDARQKAFRLDDDLVSVVAEWITA